jgi:hypothetical protein
MGPSHENGLGVEVAAGAGGGVAYMANGHITGKVVQMPLVEYLGYEPHLFVDTQSLAVGGSYTGALLPAMLESKETEKS